MLFLMKTKMSIGGKMTDDMFGQSILFDSGAAPQSDALKTISDSYRTALLPIMNAKIGLYAISISPVPAPGMRKITRNDHSIEYYEDLGTHPAAANIDPGLLTVCAHFVKYGAGTAGELFIRGYLTEAEQKTDEEANPVLEGETLDDALNTFATALVPLFKSGGGQGLVLPPGKTKPDGTAWSSLAEYTAAARPVKRVEYEGLALRQTGGSSRSVEQKTKDLARSMVQELRSAVAEAERGAPNGAIPADLVAQLRVLGSNIFRMFPASLLLKLRIENKLLAYIKA